MNIREQLMVAHSKENAELITNWIGNDKKRFKDLMNLFLSDEYRVVQRSSQVVGKVADNHPQMILPYIDKMVKNATNPEQPIAVKRNVVRVLQYIDIPEKHHGDVMNMCFDFLADVNETVAVRVFSMTILDNLTKHYPEIKQELHAILEEQLELGCTAGFRARAKNILNKK